MYVVLIVIVIACLAFDFLRESILGKIALGASIVSGGMALLGWLFDLDFFFTISKIGIAVIIIVVSIAVFMKIFDNV